MYDVDHPVYPQLQVIGNEITRAKPKAVVVFSAHWQANGSDRIKINSQAKTDLTYECVFLHRLKPPIRVRPSTLWI